MKIVSGMFGEPITKIQYFILGFGISSVVGNYRVHQTESEYRRRIKMIRDKYHK